METWIKRWPDSANNFLDDRPEQIHWDHEFTSPDTPEYHRVRALTEGSGAAGDPPTLVG
jgi:hypothetical protein